MASLLSASIVDNVALLAMARPPVNAMSRAFMAELAAGLDRAAADPAVRVIVITGSLPGMFSAGADIRELAGLDAEGCAARSPSA